MLLVEGLTDTHRFPVHSRERVMSLGDISIFTTSEDVPLSQVLENTAKKFDNNEIDAKEYSSPEKLHEFMNNVLENWDADRVHNSDIKKIISWYNVISEPASPTFPLRKRKRPSPRRHQRRRKTKV